mgnify:CR=1 FL=1
MTGRFETLSNQVQSRLDTLERTIKEYDSLQLLDQKKQVVSRSKRDIQTIQNNLLEMGRLIQTMPQRDRDFFKTDLEDAQNTFDSLKTDFSGVEAKLQDEIKKAEEAGANGGLDEELLMKNKQGAINVLASISSIMAVNNNTIKTQENSKNTLAEDRSLLNNVENNLTDIDGEANKGLERGKRMARRAIMNGVLSWTLACLFIALFVVVVIWRFVGF